MRSSSISSGLRLELDWAIIYSLRMVFNKSAKAEPEKLFFSERHATKSKIGPGIFLPVLTGVDKT